MTRIAIAQQHMLEAARHVAISYSAAGRQYSAGLSSNLRVLELAHKELMAATMEFVQATKEEIEQREAEQQRGLDRSS